MSAYPGAANRSFTWTDVEAKYDSQAEGHASETSRQQISNAVRSLEEIEVNELMRALSEVNAA